MANETITIMRNTYRQLLKTQLILDCLEEAGLENWEGVTVAMEKFREEWPKNEYYAVF